MSTFVNTPEISSDVSQTPRRSGRRLTPAERLGRAVAAYDAALLSARETRERAEASGSKRDARAASFAGARAMYEARDGVIDSVHRAAGFSPREQAQHLFGSRPTATVSAENNGKVYSVTFPDDGGDDMDGIRLVISDAA